MRSFQKICKRCGKSFICQVRQRRNCDDCITDESYYGRVSEVQISLAPVSFDEYVLMAKRSEERNR